MEWGRNVRPDHGVEAPLISSAHLRGLDVTAAIMKLTLTLKMVNKPYTDKGKFRDEKDR